MKGILSKITLLFTVGLCCCLLTWTQSGVNGGQSNVSGGGGSPGGASGQVQFNQGGAFAGDVGLTYSAGAGNGNLTIGTGNSGTFLAINNAGGPPVAGTIRVSRFVQEFCWGSNATDGCIGDGGIVSAAFGVAGIFATGTNSVSGCSLTAAVGGASAGKFASGTSGTCTVTITLPAAVNGWTCAAHDLTTAADANNVVQTAFTTTSATIAGTTVSGDVITWSCAGW